jgi:uncharacterized membrane protein YcaP (DUF421 family)
MNPYLDVVFRSVVVYLFIVIAIRIFGKREISQLSVIDLVFILLISNSVQNAMVGPSTSLEAGIIAAATLFAINRILGYLIYRSKHVSSFLTGSPTMLIYHGKVLKHHLDQTEISMDELEAAVREHGVATVGDVDLAVLEADGNISVLSNNFNHKTTHKRKAHKVIERTA